MTVLPTGLVNKFNLLTALAGLIDTEMDLDHTLTPILRLAIAYAPARSRARALALLALDHRLAAIVQSAREPVLGQLKLSWWRDRLGQPPERWPKGEPVLVALRSWGDHSGRLVQLVDGWEDMIGGGLAEMSALSDARALAWADFAELVNQSPVRDAVLSAARSWSLAELALGCANGTLRDEALAVARSEDWQRALLPRDLRSLAMLHGLAKRALWRDRTNLLSVPSDLAVAIRIGLFGR